MMKVVFFALACVAFTQVHGSELDDIIKSALNGVEVMTHAGNMFLKSLNDEYNGTQSKLVESGNTYIQKQAEFRDEAISATKNESTQLKQKAKDSKLPEQVTKCITKEEEAAISAISGHTTKYQADVKRIRAEKDDILAHHGKEIRKNEQYLTAMHDQAVADINKCTTVESVRQIYAKLEVKYWDFISILGDLQTRMGSNYLSFENEMKLRTVNANNAITATKTLGIKKMRECFPKLFHFFF